MRLPTSCRHQVLLLCQTLRVLLEKTAADAYSTLVYEKDKRDSYPRPKGADVEKAKQVCTYVCLLYSTCVLSVCFVSVLNVRT